MTVEISPNLGDWSKEYEDQVFAWHDAHQAKVHEFVARQAEMNIEFDRLIAEEKEKVERLAKWIKMLGLRRTGAAPSAAATSAIESKVSQGSKPGPDGRMTIKAMILSVIPVDGSPIKPQEIKAAIFERFKVETNAGLYTQIARLADDGVLEKVGKAWRRTQKNAG